MATEFNVDLPPRYQYEAGKSPEENFMLLDAYILSLHTSLEDMLKDLFIRVSDVADSPTAGNIATVDEDGNVQDSGKTISIDGTFAANSDEKLPTEKAIGTFVADAISGQKLNEHAAPDGNVDFNDKQAIDFIVENRTDDTGMTVTGQMWFRTDA